MNEGVEGGEALILCKGDVSVVVHSEDLRCVIDRKASDVLNVCLC